MHTMAVLVAFLSAGLVFAQRAEVLIDGACAMCHERGSAGQAPDRAALRKKTPEAIYQAITTGSMREQAASLTDAQKRVIAENLGGRKLGVAEIADAKTMPNHCAGSPPIDLAASPAWNGWSAEVTNTRFQAAKSAGLTADQASKLKLKWAFGLPGAANVSGQPTVAGGRVFIGADTGFVYALDAATGCVYWSFQADAGVRTAPSVGSVPGNKHAVYFGDGKGNVYAVNAATGELLWKVSVEDHPTVRLTGAPKLYEGRLYVPVASGEEGVGGLTTYYPCCTFRGSVVALDAATGKQIWKTYVIAETPKPTRKTSKVQLWGPAGGGVWNSPTIDAKRRALYIGTGDAYTEPAAKTTDAIMALSLDNGKVLWSVQDLGNDAWLVGCAPTNENCPKEPGPDYDFGSSPILKTLANGRSILIAGQKSGDVWAHDPDRKGAVVWRTKLASKPPGPGGQIVWGGAADDQHAYFGLNSGGVAALDLKDGERKWFTPLEPVPERADHRGHEAAVTAFPGVVLSGGWDGILRALAADSGRVVWEFNLGQEFQTVNGVAAKGGSMGSAGPTVAGGMVFAGAGYIGVQNGIPGNVLLAFSAE